MKNPISKLAGALSAYEVSFKVDFLSNVLVVKDLRRGELFTYASLHAESKRLVLMDDDYNEVPYEQVMNAIRRKF